MKRQGSARSMPKCLGATRVSKASTRPQPNQLGSKLICSFVLCPFHISTGSAGHGLCGMTLVFCSLRHYTAPHSVFSVGWLLPPQPHPVTLFPLHPACRLPALLPRRTPALIDKVPSRNRTRGTTLWEDPGGPNKRITGEDHALRAPGCEAATRQHGLWACHHTY